MDIKEPLRTAANKEKLAPLTEFEFRQRLALNPFDDDTDMQLFRQSHPQSTRWVKEAKMFEETLQATMAVSPPENLQNKILLQQGFSVVAEQIPLKKFRGFKWGAMAASFTLVALALSSLLLPGLTTNTTTGFVQVASAEGQLDMVADIYSHVLEHSGLMNATHQGMDDSVNVQALLASVGATLNKPIDFMSYAGECNIDGRKGLHIVLQEEAGPVTVFVIPGERIGSMLSFEKGGLHGEIIPIYGGVVAILGQTGLQIALAQTRLFKSVKFG